MSCGAQSSRLAPISLAGRVRRLTSRRAWLVLLALWLLGGSLGCDWLGRSGPPNVLLITVDTLRADHLGVYGYARRTSPHIDALAGEGFRFKSAMVQWPKTWASTASLLTGTYPRTNGVQVAQSLLSPRLPVLSELFAEAGYATAAVVANFNIGRKWGYGRGFQQFVESWRETWEEEERNKLFINQPGRVKQYTNATLVTDQGLRWLDASEPAAAIDLGLDWLAEARARS